MESPSTAFTARFPCSTCSEDAVTGDVACPRKGWTSAAKHPQHSNTFIFISKNAFLVARYEAKGRLFLQEKNAIHFNVLSKAFPDVPRTRSSRMLAHRSEVDSGMTTFTYLAKPRTGATVRDEGVVLAF